MAANPQKRAVYKKFMLKQHKGNCSIPIVPKKPKIPRNADRQKDTHFPSEEKGRAQLLKFQTNQKSQVSHISPRIVAS